KPVESGSVSFFPEDGNGPTVGGGVEEGQFSVTGLTPGKKRVKLTITAAGETKPGGGRSMRKQEIKEDIRQGKANRAQGKVEPKATEVKELKVDIVEGMQPVTLEFQTASAGGR